MVLGGVLLLVSVLGGNFKIWGAEVGGPISSWHLRVLAGVLGIVFELVVILQSFLSIPTALDSGSSSSQASPQAAGGASATMRAPALSPRPSEDASAQRRTSSLAANNKPPRRREGGEPPKIGETILPIPAPAEPIPASVQATAKENSPKAAIQDLVARLKMLPVAERSTTLLTLPDSQVKDLIDLTEWNDFEALLLNGVSGPDLARLLWKTIYSIPLIQDSTSLRELMDDPNTFYKKDAGLLDLKQKAVVDKLRDLKNNPVN